ncbi:MAG: DUF4870 domain-containing protein [Candidatus Gracilibacteria bacterium]|nr:DUF4870 domain-containing protein [Candidatus Gracilibacteria bacterium]
MDQANKNSDIEKNRDVAAFAWTLIFAPVLIVMRKDSEFIQFHAKQALVFLILAVLIAVLPYNLPKLNILTVAIAVAGFINANQGRWWKVPFVSGIINQDLTPQNITHILKNLSLNSIDIIQRIFKNTASHSHEVAKKAHEAHENVGDLKGQMSFLEREFVKEKYLRGHNKSELSKKAQEAINKIEVLLINHKFIQDDNSDFSSFTKSQTEVLFGNFDNKGGVIFVNFTKNKDSADLTFGSWCGFAVVFDDLDKEISKIKCLI